MKVGQTRSGSPRPIASTGAAREAGRAYAARAVADAGAAAPTADVTTIAGIPGDELTPKVRDAIELLMHEVQRMRQELEQAEKRVAYLEKLADEDSLVPVANRRAFVRELSRMVAYSERYNSVSSVLYFDIDGFKEINDTYGHAAGDAALRHIGEIFSLNVRESDVVGRLGGDEFGVILAQSDAAAAAEKAAGLAQAIETTPLIWENRGLKLHASCGAYTFSGKENAGEALQRADSAMYKQKQVRAAAAGR
jgi:diguanylate cyclase (GGDEF)-like protein